MKQFIVALLLLCAYPVAFAGDSPSQVAKYFSANREGARIVMRDADAFLAKASNPEFAARLMVVAKSNDKIALAKFIKESVQMKSDVEVDEIDNDFCVKFHLVKVGKTWRASLEIHGGKCR